MNPIAPPAGRPTGLRLDDSAAHALRIVASGMAGLLALMPPSPARLPPDLSALRSPRWRPLAESLRSVAAILVREVLTRGRQPDFKREVGALAAALNALPLEQADIEPYQDVAWHATSELMTEIALDQHGMRCEFRERDGAAAAVLVPLAPRLAESLLLPRLCEHLFTWATLDALAQLDLGAGQWMFRRWAGPREAGTAPEAFARFTRELEWLLLDRESVAFDSSVVRAFLARTPRDDPSPRQRELARRLVESFCGILLVKERRGELTILEDVVQGRRCEFIEYNPDLAYAAGDYAVGRLFRLPSGRYHRSPGMAFWRLPGGGAQPLIEHHLRFRRMFPDIDTALVLEGTIRFASGATVIPDDIDPPPAPAEARQLLDFLRDRLEQAGKGELAALIPNRPITADSRDADLGGLVELDASLIAWLAMLTVAAAAPS